jgi:hypothetical protein
MRAGRAEGLVASLARASGRMRGAKRENAMLTIIKIAVAALITFGVLNPSFTPRAEDAKCSCKADT